jgi:hypothetical protein
MYEDPPDFEAFDLLTAEQLNILSQDIEALHEGTGFGTGSGWAWTSSVPTITGSTTDPTLGDSTVTGWYRRTGRELKYHIRVVVGSGFSAGSGAWRFSVPVALAAHSGVYAVTASGYVTDVSPAEVALISGVEVIDSTQIEVYAGKAGGFGGLGAAFPFALASGDVIDFMLIGETVGS